jgi:hypothetical protein
LEILIPSIVVRAGASMDVSECASKSESVKIEPEIDVILEMSKDPV